MLDVFLPTSDGLLVHLHENMAAVRDLVGRLPEIFKGQRDTHSCMGAAIQVAHKLLMSTGGRITILQTYLPTLGPGALKAREDPNMRAAKEVQFLQPATDFYKTLALECSSTQVAVDLFLLSGQYADLTTICKLRVRREGGNLALFSQKCYVLGTTIFINCSLASDRISTSVSISK
jgi:protein transport protein SEC24